VQRGSHRSIESARYRAGRCNDWLKAKYPAHRVKDPDQPLVFIGTGLVSH
jgi:hypothetical protein